MNPVRVGVGILNWNGSGETIECLESVITASIEAREIAVIDNGSTDASLAEIVRFLGDQRWKAREQKGIWQEWTSESQVSLSIGMFGHNRGVGAGFREIIEWAMSRGCEWVWLLDQDSRPTRGTLRHLLASGLASRADVIVPLRVDRNDDRIRYVPWRWRGGRWRRLSEAVISDPAAIEQVDGSGFSGMLIHQRTWELGIVPRTDFFVGYEDMEYCLRLRDARCQIVWAQGAQLLHRRGGSQLRSLAGLSFVSGGYRSDRYYYIARNRIFTHARLRRRALEVLFVFAGLFVRALKVIVAESEKLSKLRFIVLGLRDGLLGRMGERQTFQKPISRGDSN